MYFILIRIGGVDFLFILSLLFLFKWVAVQLVSVLLLGTSGKTSLQVR